MSKCPWRLQLVWGLRGRTWWVVLNQLEDFSIGHLSERVEVRDGEMRATCMEAISFITLYCHSKINDGCVPGQCWPTLARYRHVTKSVLHPAYQKHAKKVFQCDPVHFYTLLNVGHAGLFYKAGVTKKVLIVATAWSLVLQKNGRRRGIVMRATASTLSENYSG